MIIGGAARTTNPMMQHGQQVMNAGRQPIVGQQGATGNPPPGKATTPPPAFNAQTDPRRTQYLNEYNNPNTTAARKSAIDAKWQFGQQQTSPTGAPAGTNVPPNPPPTNFSKVGNAANVGDLANAQEASNYNSTDKSLFQNRVNQGVQGIGSTVYGMDPVTGQPTQITTLDPTNRAIQQQDQASQQGLYGLGSMYGQQAQQNGALNFNRAPNMPQAGNFSNAPNMPGVSNYGQLQNVPGQNGLSGYANQVNDSVYNQLKSRLDPQFQQQDQQFQQQMANQGVAQGSPLYARLAMQQAQAKNDAYNTAANQAVQTGIGARESLFGQGLQTRQQGVNELNNQFGQGLGLRQQGIGEQGQAFGQGMQARQQGVGEAQSLYQSPLMALGQTMGLTKGAMMPNAAPIFNAGYNPVDIAGLGSGRYNQDTSNLTNEQIAQINAQAMMGAAAMKGKFDLQGQQLAANAEIQRQQLANAGGLAQTQQLGQNQINAQPSTGSQIGSGLGTIGGSIGTNAINNYVNSLMRPNPNTSPFDVPSLDNTSQDFSGGW